MGRCLAVAAAALVWATAAHAYSAQDVRLQMSDGVGLAATLYLPEGGPPAAGFPAVVLLHGIGGSRASSNGIAEAVLAPNGYAVLTYDLRGHGQSGGVNDIDGPREIRDVRELVAWLGDRADVDADRIGAVGISLGGGAVWRAAAEGVPLAAIVPVTTWTDLYRAFVPNGLSKSGAVLGFVTALPGDRLSPTITAAVPDLVRSRNLAAIRALARERSTLHLIDRVRAPVFMVQGRRDFAFDLREIRSAWRALRVPKRLYVGDLGHAPATNPPAETAYVFDEARRWFDRWLKGLPNGVDMRRPIEVAPDPWSRQTVSFASFPQTRSLRLSFPGRRTIGPLDKVVRTLRLPPGRLETFGAPRLRVTAATRTGWPHVVAVLSALRADGAETVVSAGGTSTATLGRRERVVAFSLIDQATAIPHGARLRLTIATSSTAQNPANLLYLRLPASDRLKVEVGRVRLALPVLKRPITG